MLGGKSYLQTTLLGQQVSALACCTTWNAIAASNGGGDENDDDDADDDDDDDDHNKEDEEVWGRSLIELLLLGLGQLKDNGKQSKS